MLAPFCKLLLNCAQHARRIKEARIIGVDQRNGVANTIRFRFDLAYQALVINGESLLAPLFPTRFQNPQTHYILEKPNRAERAAFIGKVLPRCVHAKQWSVDLDSD